MDFTRRRSIVMTGTPNVKEEFYDLISVVLNEFMLQASYRPLREDGNINGHTI